MTTPDDTARLAALLTDLARFVPVAAWELHRSNRHWTHPQNHEDRELINDNCTHPDCLMSREFTRLIAAGVTLCRPAPDAALDFPPDIRLGMNQNDLGVFEVWAKRDRQALAYRSGSTLNGALDALRAALAPAAPEPDEP